MLPTGQSVLDERLMNTSGAHPLTAGPASQLTAVPPARPWHAPANLWQHKTTAIAALAVLAILLHIGLRFGYDAVPAHYNVPLLVALTLGGIPLVYDLLHKLFKGEFGSDLLGGISIVASVMLGEY